MGKWSIESGPHTFSPMAERITASEGMTVDELLAKLDAEYDRLESELPQKFLELGRCVFSYPSSPHTYEINQIEEKRNRQAWIRDFQRKVKQEVLERVTE